MFKKRVTFELFIWNWGSQYAHILRIFGGNTLVQKDTASNSFIFKIFEDDNLPHNICTPCLNTLKESYKLKQLCESSILFYQNLLASSQAELDEKETEDDCGKFSCCLPIWITEITLKVVDDETQISQVLSEPDKANQECKTYKCTDCTREFKTEKDFLVHQSIHGTELKCNACGKLFHCKLT